MPPERKPQASAESDAPDVDQILAGGPDIDENHPEYAFHQAIAAEEARPPVSEDDSQQEEQDNDAVQEQEGDAGLPEDFRQAIEAERDEAQAQEEEQEVDDDRGDVTLPRDAYDRIVEMLGLDAEEAPVAAPVPAQEAKAEEPVQEQPKPEVRPIEEMGLRLPKDDDEFVDIMSSAEAYNQHVSGLIEHAVTSTLSRVEPLIAQRASYIYQAQRFNEQFFEKHPNVPVQLAIKGLAAAQKKLGPNATWDDLFVETEKNCAFAEAVARNHKKASSRGKNTRGRFSPKTARQTRPAQNTKKLSPTEEALRDISQPMHYTAQDAQFLRDVGAL